MGRRANRTGRSKTQGKFLMIEGYVFQCPAYRSLSLAARCALDELLFAYNGTNNGTIGMGTRYLGSRLGRGHATATRALHELEEREFIETTKIGSFTRRNRKASEYRLLMRRCDLSGHTPAKKFMQWVPASPAPLAHPRANTGSPVKQGASKPTLRYRQKPSTGSPMSPSGPSRCLTGEPHIDLPDGCREPEGERGAGTAPSVPALVAAAIGQTDDYPDMPPFLRRHANES